MSFELCCGAMFLVSSVGPFACIGPTVHGLLRACFRDFGTSMVRDRLITRISWSSQYTSTIVCTQALFYLPYRILREGGSSGEGPRDP